MTTHSYFVDDDRPAVSYGPKPSGGDRWVLAFTAEGERVELELGEQTMYELWIEVRGVPWPDANEHDRLVRQVLHAANSADREMLEDALEALGVGER